MEETKALIISTTWQFSLDIQLSWQKLFLESEIQAGYLIHDILFVMCDFAVAAVLADGQIEMVKKSNKGGAFCLTMSFI